MKLTVKQKNRLIEGIKRFQPILNKAKEQDINEADTSSIVIDILAETLGFEKYEEITSEYAVKGTYCDLAVRVSGKILMFIEVKAIGTELKDQHIKQAVDYATNNGTDWVVLTNARSWKVYKLIWGKPVEQREVITLNYLDFNPRNEEDIEKLSLISKESLIGSSLSDYFDQKQALDRFTLGALLLTEPVLKLVRRELRKMVDDVKIHVDDIKNILSHEVLRREMIEGEQAEGAKRKVNRAASKAGRRKEEKYEETSPETELTERQELSEQKILQSLEVQPALSNEPSA